MARNVETGEIKYFISNAAARVPLSDLLTAAFAHWPIERCFEQAKNELGMDHFEVRGWRSIHRHLYITQLSHLFCVRVHRQLREKNDGHALPNRRTSPPGGLYLRTGPVAPARRDAYEKTAESIAYYQRRNRAARQSHTRTTIRRLAQLGVKLLWLPSCAPRDP